jgi:cell division protein FtsL
MLIILALWRLRQEAHEFKANLSCSSLYTEILSQETKGQGGCSEVEHLSSIHKILGLFPNTAKSNKKETKEKSPESLLS